MQFVKKRPVRAAVSSNGSNYETQNERGQAHPTQLTISKDEKHCCNQHRGGKGDYCGPLARATQSEHQTRKNNERPPAARLYVEHDGRREPQDSPHNKCEEKCVQHGNTRHYEEE